MMNKKITVEVEVEPLDKANEQGATFKILVNGVLVSGGRTSFEACMAHITSELKFQARY
jgi:hypothetical protein